MDTRRLGTLEVSAQGLSCFPGFAPAEVLSVPGETIEPGAGGHAARTLHRALDLGITLFDVPAAAQDLVGRALRGRRDRAVLATTLGPRPDSAASVRQACEASLRRLGVDHLDLYYLTAPSETAAELVAPELVAAELVAAGKVRHIGLTGADAATIRRAHAVHPITAVRVEWSPWSRDAESTIIPTCRELGIGVVAHSPLSRAFPRHPHPPGDLRPLTTGRPHPDSVMEAVRAVAAEHDVSPARIALAWVHHRGAVPIPGAARVKALEENVAAASLTLTPRQLALIG
ncbi:aldo/keto reductase [Saccharothrix sp. NPDC042600]|uniref:aldo/keto reductase n=1 Tax=Saccharothrix TaxID=2071 RepID=UPI0033E430DA|nr:aldo/keto reductase [Saccharothrix mutabilis subsp. capreolus]